MRPAPQPDFALPYRYSPRSYQTAPFEAYQKGIRRFITVWHRKSGKDLTWWNFLITRAVEKVGLYWYVFPTIEQGKKALWFGFSNESEQLKFLDHIPRELVKSINGSDFRIELVNGSLIQLIGSDGIDRIVGPNPVGIVLSEYAVQMPNVWALLAPIIEQNMGWVAFNSTPRGRNHLFDLWEIAGRSPDYWFRDLRTVRDTRRDSTGEDGDFVLTETQMDRIRSEHDADYVEQEYYCSFYGAHTGAYFAKIITDLQARNQIGNYPWYPEHLVYTVWDIGMRDSTAIWFAQNIGREIHLIDYFENSGEGLPYYVRELKNRPYAYSAHYAPHDIAVKEWGSSKTRWEMAGELGIQFRPVPNISPQDGIDAARALLQRCWFDRIKCDAGIRALQNYAKEWDEKRGEYKPTPMHNKWSHAADAFRYLSLVADREGASFLQPTVVEQDFEIFEDKNALNLFRTT